MRATRRIDPIAQFMQDHDQLLVQLSVLNKSARAMETTGYAVEHFQRLMTVVGYIEEEIRVHNASEEAALFPVLDRYVEGPTRMMRDDHRQLKKEFLQLRKLAHRAAGTTRNKELIAELAAQCRTLVQLFVNHIHKENHILFPLVQKFLTKDALREVARRMTSYQGASA
jgi:hemerythrin-like domain-containing protein